MKQKSKEPFQALLSKPRNWFLIIALGVVGSSGWVIRLLFGESWALLSWFTTLVMYLGLNWLVLDFVKTEKQE